MPDPSQLLTIVAGIQARSAQELDACERFLTDTRRAWRLVQQVALAGWSADDQADWAELAGKAQGYVSINLTEATFQQSFAIFEAFFSGLLTAWLTAYPDSLRKKQFEFGLALDAADRDGVIAGVIGAEVGGLLYKSLADQFAYLAGRVGIAPPSSEQMGRLVEAKATRNVLVHNRGLVNAQYLTLAGPAARYALGQRVEVPEPYRRQVWELLSQLVTDLSAASLAKLAPDLPPPAAAG